MARLSAVLLLVASACNEPDVDDRICTDAGCESSTRLVVGTFPVTSFQDVAPYALFDVCLNSACRHVTIDKLPDMTGGISVDDGGELEPGPRVSVQLTPRYSGDIDIAVTMATDDVDLFHDGDVYEVVFNRFDGAVVASGRWSVDYRIIQPNGPMCEPTCRLAMTVTPI